MDVQALVKKWKRGPRVTRPRMTRFEVDRACGQTPCLCGDIETWHPECYAGKAVDEVSAGYKRAYAIARRKLMARSSEAVASFVNLARIGA